jgi:MFS family permease
MRSVLESPTLGTMFLVWTALIMFVLRFFAGPIVDRINPLGLLAASAAVAALGLLWLANAGSSAWLLFAAATFYGLGKTFFWPTTLGVVSEQYPRGGALMLNAIAGVGMISVGTIGNPAIGAVQDRTFTAEIREVDPLLADQVIGTRPGLFGESESLDPAMRATLVARLDEHRQALRSQLVAQTGGTVSDAQLEQALASDPVYQTLAGQVNQVTIVETRSKQGALAIIAILPAIMFLCYFGLILYFRQRGGYRAKHILEEEGRASDGRDHVAVPAG